MMILSSPRSLRATSIKHHDRELTLVFGSDGQISLIDSDGGTASQPLEASPTFIPADTGSPALGTRSLSSESTPVTNLEATSTSLTDTSSSTLGSTTVPSLESSTHDPSSTATDTDTNLPSIPTINYPTPSPTAIVNPRDHGVGAPFYLAIVLASISFVGCVAALIAWWIRSRARKRDVELDDPWLSQDSISKADGAGAVTENVNQAEKGPNMDVETMARPYYLPASIVHRSSSNLLAVPHTIPILPEGASQNNGIPRTAETAGRYPPLRRANDIRYQNVPSSQSNTRPDTARLQTGLSVQESTRTLGRLRVANRVPGDVTSGDEGGMNIPRLRHSAGLLPAANSSGPNAALAGESTMQNTQFGQSSQPVQEGDNLLEPPGPATLSWGRRMNTVAALQRSQRRATGTTDRTYKNPRYGGYLYLTPGDGPSGTTWKVPANNDREESNKALANPPPDPLDWKNSLKSSFWQAVDAVTGSRSSDPEPRAENVGSGSRFTPAPERAASRRSPVSPTASSSLSGTRGAAPQVAETGYGPALSEMSATTKQTLQNLTHSVPGSLLRTNELEILRVDENVIGTNRRQPDSLKTDTGSVYSTDSATARANLRKYGYGSLIPSSWSALGAHRESQLDLNRTDLSLSGPMRSASPGSLSTIPSYLMSESSLHSRSAGTRTPVRSQSDAVGSDDGTVQSGKDAGVASYVDTSTGSTYDVSRNGTVQSAGRDTTGRGSVASRTPSTRSSVLGRKKGVTTRRKRPRPPPRAPSTASSVQSIESGLSMRDVAVRRALLERRRKVKAAGSLEGGEDVRSTSRDADSFLL